MGLSGSVKRCAAGQPSFVLYNRSMTGSRNDSPARGKDSTDPGLASPDLDPGTLKMIRKLVATNAALAERLDSLSAELERARALADHDPLCPVFNRRAFLRELNREIAVASRHGTALSILFVDLDAFKAVNDRFGHAAGDEVLRETARILAECVRKTDVVARIGGDEFGVILVRANETEAAGRIGGLMSRLEAGSDALRGVTATVGPATWRPGATAESLLAEADRAMFARKPGAQAKPWAG